MNLLSAPSRNIAKILIIGFLYAAIGYPPLFLINLHFHKISMQNTGERKNDDVKNLETITVPQSYTEGVNPNFVMIDAREFRYNGMMYDIVERKEQGDSITYVCVRDSKEEKMLGHFAKKSNTGTANVRGGLLLLPMFIVSNEFYTMTVYPPYSEKSGRYTFLSHSPLFIDYDVPTPPPKNEIYSDRIS